MGLNSIRIIRNPKSIEAEEYRMIRTNLLFSDIDKKNKTIMVTSAEPGVGKTTTICNLAISISQAGFKTLIIDLDLRKQNFKLFTIWKIMLG